MSRWTDRTAWELPADQLKYFFNKEGVMTKSPLYAAESLTGDLWRDYSGHPQVGLVADSRPLYTQGVSGGLTVGSSTSLNNRTAVSCNGISYGASTTDITLTTFAVIAVVRSTSVVGYNDTILFGNDESYSLAICRNDNIAHSWLFGVDEGALADMCPFTMTDGIPHLLECVREGTARKVYVDGVLAGSQTGQSGSAITTALNVAGSPYTEALLGQIGFLGILSPTSADWTFDTGIDFVPYRTILRDYYGLGLT